MRKAKMVIMAILFIGTAYPVLELTRCIVKYMIIEDMGLGPISNYWMELSLIWSFYLVMFWMVNKAINLVWLMGRREGYLSWYSVLKLM